MISGESPATTDYDIPPPSATSLPLTVLSPSERTRRDTFLYTHFQQNVPCFEQSPPSSRDTSPDLKAAGQYDFVTSISPRHKRQIPTFDFPSPPPSTSSSSASSSPSSSSEILPCSNYSTNSSFNQSQLYRYHIEHTTESTQHKYSTQQPSYLEFPENQEHFFTTNSDDINTNSTFLNLNSKLISDFLSLNSLPFETDFNNNQSNINDLNDSHNNTFINNNTKITEKKTSPSDNHQKVRLPPFSALLSNHSIKAGVLESSQSIMRTQDNLFDDVNDDNDTNMNSSFSSIGEETHYTDLTNVGQSRLDEDQSCMAEAPELNFLEWSCNPEYSFKSEPSDVYETEDILYLGPNIHFPDPCDELNMGSPTTDSDGYSSSAERDSFSHYLSDINATDVTSHGSNTTASYSGHDSSSDEGYGEGTIPEYTLPDFAKLQNRADQDKIPERKCSRALLSKEKKKSVRESLHYVEKVRQKPGRKPGQVSNVLHLWEFMRDLLHSPDNQGIIEWISRPDGVFRVMNSTEVARLWGEKKKNKKEMTYEKLSRSLRYSRLEGYFANLPRDKNYPKKLCFKFGPKSRNWR